MTPAFHAAPPGPNNTGRSHRIVGLPRFQAMTGCRISRTACATVFLLAYDIDWDPETAAETGFYWLRVDPAAEPGHAPDAA